MQLILSRHQTHEGHVTRPSTGRNADFVDISMEIASALPKGKLATSVVRRTTFNQGADHPIQW